MKLRCTLLFHVVFDEAGINLTEPYISSCGSGTTACWITLAAFLCGKDVPMFDVSEVYLIQCHVLMYVTYRYAPDAF